MSASGVIFAIVTITVTEDISAETAAEQLLSTDAARAAASEAALV